jgi:predicted phage terminase large subunit-like protein
VNAPLTKPDRSIPGVAWVPTKMQEAGLVCGAFELFLGGAAGPGKSEYLVVAALRNVHHAGYRAVLFRNSFPELQRSLLTKAAKLYPSKGGVYKEQTHTWTFPGPDGKPGATIEFAYLERDADVHRYQGAEYHFVGFDELPHFTEHQYRYMLSRLRGTDGVPVRMRATGNPDGPHLEWVRARFVEWIEGRAVDGAALWYNPDGRIVPKGTEYALSRSYIRGKLSDNPYLGDDYRAQLMALDPVTRAKLLDGDWDACVGEGKLFHRTWWHYFDSAPAVKRKVRAWDLGAGGDPTEGVLEGDRGAKGPDGLPIVPRYVVLDCITHVGPPHEVHKLILDTAKADGVDVVVRLPQDPGQAGKDQALTYARELTGYRVVTKPVTGDKVLRAGGYSSQVGARNFGIVRAPWTAAFVSQHHAFPDTRRDDKVDAGADAFSELALGTGFYADRLRDAVDAQTKKG